MDIKAFRSQYPQYDSVPDQKLVDGLYNKFYSQLPKDEFYNRIGFAPPAPEAPTTEAPTTEEAPTTQVAPQPEPAAPVVARQEPAQEAPVAEQAPTAEQPAPSMLERMGSFLTQPLPVSDADKLVAGSLKKGFKQLAQVPAATVYAELSGLQAAREAQYGKDLENAPPEVKARHEETAKELQRLQKEAALAGVERKQIEAEYGINPLAKRLGEVSQDKEYKDADFFGKAKQYGNVLINNAEDIPGYIGTLGLESLPSSIASISAALLTRFLPGGGSRVAAATAAGGTSGFLEFGSNYADLRQQGMGHEEAWEKAAVKSGVIGLFDAVSFGSAGKAASEVMKKVEQGAAIAAAKQTVKGSTVQGAYGAAGEGGGSAVIGEELDPIKMGAEFAGEFLFSPLEGAAAYAGYKQAAQTPPAQPTAEQPTAEQPTTEQPTAEQPVTEQQPEEPTPTYADEYGYVNLPEYQELVKKREAASAQFTALSDKADSLPEGSDERNEANIAASKFYTDAIEPLQEQLDAVRQAYVPQASTPVAETTATPEEEMVTSTAPGISVSYPKERTEPSFTVDPETGEVVTAPVAQVEAEQNPVIERRALELRQVNGYPAEVALSVARREFAEGDLNVEPISGEQPGAEAVTGRIEPSISMPSEGAAAPEGVAPLDTERLAGAVGAVGEPDVGAGVQRTALTEIPRVQVGPNPNSFVNTNAQIARDQSDRLGLTEKIEASFAKGLTANQVRQELKNELNVLPQDERSEFVIQVRATLGIPSQASEEGKVEFKEWQNNYNNRKISTLTQRAPTPVQQAEVALQNAEQAVTAAATPVEKKAATVERNKARQELKKVQAEAPAVEAVAPTTAPAVEAVAPVAIEESIAKTAQESVIQDGIERYAKALTRNRIQQEDNDGDLPPRKYNALEKVADGIAERLQAFGMSAFEAESFVRSNIRPAARQIAYPKESAISPTAPKRGRPAKAPVEGAVPVEPKKRGRPAKVAELTPEERAFKDAERQQNQEDLIKASRGVSKTIKIAGATPQEAKYKTPEEFEMAKVAAASARKTAIYRLHQYATSPAFRSAKASGVKAAQYLASDAVTPKERADLQARLEFEKTRGPKPSAARKKTKEKADPAYYKFTTATQAIDYITRTGTPFERILAARLKPFVSDINLTVADTQENTPDAIKALLTDASGVYSSARYGEKVHRMIVLRGENFDDPAMQGMNNTIFLHEALHGATEAKIDEYLELVAADMAVPAPLQAAMNDLMSTMIAAQDQYQKLKASGQPISPNLRHKFAKLDITNDLKEFVAYGLTDPDVQQFLLQAPGIARKDQALGYLKNLFSGFVNSLRKAFNMDAKHQSALQDLMLATEGILREQEIEPAQSANTLLNTKKEKVDKNLEKIRLSPDSIGMIEPIEQNVKDGHTYSDFNNLMQARLDAMGSGFIKKTLYTMPTPDIIRWQGDAIPALKNIDILIQKMAGSQMNMERAFTKKADQLAKFVRKVGKKKQLLANAMHLARLNSVSPTLFKDRADAIATDKRMVQLDKLLTNPATPQEELPTITRKRTIRENQINQTFDAWEKLGTLKGGQDMYRMVRQFYKDANVLTRTLLDERIERLNVEGSIDDPSTPKGKLMLAVRRMQEDSDFKGIDEYFPFMRYGNFWLRVNGPQGREFYLFENGTERNAFLTRRAQELGVDPKSESETFDAGDDLTALRTQYSPESKMLADMFETIDNEMDKPGVDKDALKDALYQTYLMTLPEESYRKQFLHSENVTGFSSDVLRNFTTSANRIASQSAKLTYGDQISAEVQRARDTLKGMPVLKKAKLELFVNEMSARVQDELNPTPESKAITRINQFAYYSLLTGVASAITQTTALPLLVMPVLNQEYGYGSSAAKFTKYMALWKSVGVTQEGADGEVVYVAPTMGESRLVKSNPILQRAFQEAIDRGLTAQTNSSVLTNRNRTPDSAYSNIPRAALRTTATVMSSLFTGAERMTREMAYLMTFELEYAKTKDFDASVQKAVDTVQELLGRYDNFGRPRSMRNVVGRTVGQFKMYAVNMTSFLIRNAYTMFTEVFKGNPKESLAAMHRLGGVLTMAAVFGGVTSFPMYSLVTSVIDLMLDAFGDDEEKKRRMAENPYTANSSDLRFRYEFLPQMFGDIKITGLDGKPRTLAAVLEKGAVSELGDFNIGSRTTYDGMWFRDAKPGNTTQETITNYIVANLGPAVSSGLSMTGAVDDFSDGKIARGLERIAPALIKNPLTAARLAKEGAKTPAGDVVMSKEEFSSFNIAMQSLGFQSTALARYQENKYKLQQETVAATKNRSDILGKLDNAILGSDASDKDLERVFERIDKFNDRFVAMKHLRIDSDTIKRVIDRAKEKEGFTFRGMYIRKEDLPYLLELRDTTERPQK